MNKRKIINDPVYGFINVHSDLIFDLIEHPFFQRLRRIRQLGLTCFVYPGATHTRFQHAIGTTYLMGLALNVIRSKGHDITPEEADAAQAAILLHDAGHWPFSHTLEHSLVSDLNHEDMSLLIMKQINREMGGGLNLAIEIFQGNYKKQFLHQLVSSQLDMDRMDYLRRDVFFTGVNEGIIGSDRIIKMLDVVNDQLVVEAKGIYSIEKFLIARRLMYWQVYFHKTVIAAENLLVMMLKRATFLAKNDKSFPATPALTYFLHHNIVSDDLLSNSSTVRDEAIHWFSQLDDDDIFISAKIWLNYPDRVIQNLAYRLLNRKLFKIHLESNKFDKARVNTLRKAFQVKEGFSLEESKYFVFSDSISNNTYDYNDSKIQILFKTGELIDISDASDMFDIDKITTLTRKYFLCYPKDLTEQ
ncbi:MAG: HD domain-containing protein [Bacteroidota bacterium]